MLRTPKHGALAIAAVAALTAGARCGPRPDCPLEVRRWYLSGKAPQVVLRNRAAHPVDSIVLHVAYEDLFGRYQEPSQALDTIVQPGQRLTVSLDPIPNSVDWETVRVFATCRTAAATRDASRPAEPPRALARPVSAPRRQAVAAPSRSDARSITKRYFTSPVSIRS